MTQTRIAVCSDTHFWFNSTQRFGQNESQLQPWSEVILNTLLTELKEATPDLICHLGDVTCGGGSFAMPDTAFFSTLDHVFEAFAPLPAETYFLPGNHDCPAGGGNWRYFEQQTGLGVGLGQTIDLPQMRIVLLNAQGHSEAQLAQAAPGDPTSGWVNEAELARLDDALATAAQKPVLLFCHQLLQPYTTDQPWKDLYGIDNGAAVLAIMEKHANVRAVFQGHAHRLDVQQVVLGGRPCTFVVQPALIEYPLAWLQLDISSSNVQVTVQALSLEDLAARSLVCNPDDGWRSGRSEWQMFTILDGIIG